MPDWQEEFKRKLTRPEQAVKVVKSGDTVAFAWSAGEPWTLCRALEGRVEELKDVKPFHTIGGYNAKWFQKDWGEKAFSPRSLFLSTFDRPGHDAGEVAYVPYSVGLLHQMDEREDYWKPDVFMTRVSPPDKNGFCSYGHMIWYSNLMARHAKKIVAQIDPLFIRTRGSNYIHVSQIDSFVETAPGDGMDRSNFLSIFGMPQIALTGIFAPSDDEKLAIEVIGTQVAELVNDGDTIFFGGGTFSFPTVNYLEDKQDLAIHSEVMPAGAVDLVRKGVFNGKKRTLHQGVAVTATCFMPQSFEDLDYIDGNPLFHIYGVEYTNHIKTIASHRNIVSINNALFMDLVGQVDCESIGPRQWTGTGGQLEFTLGAMTAPGGRSIHVLQSFYRDKDGHKHSRIVPMLEPGSIVGVPRTFIDYVITEQGAVNLQGKSLRERADALISIADPDFRGELRKQAHKLWLK